MENIIATLPEKMAVAQAVASQYDSPTQAITIKSAARECFRLFTEDEAKSVTRVQMVLAWVEAGFTPGEVDKVLSEALLMAKEADTASGFNAAGKKGRAAYGLNQSVMASRASECRTVYGAATQGALSMMKEKGWQAAINLGRMWLEEKGKLWDGNNRPTKDEKAARKAAKETHKAFVEAASANPMKAGENHAEYAARLAQEAAHLTKATIVAKMVETLKGWDQKCVMEAIHEFLLGKNPDELRMMASQLQADADEIERAQDIARAARSEEEAPM